MNNVAQKYVNSINYLEFINNLDDVFYDLLYSSQRGYINLHSKNAILDFSSYCDKFDWEISKLSDKVSFSNMSQIVNIKKNDFINELKKHFNQELQNWAQEVFDNFIQNTLFSVGLNKENKKELDLIYNRALSAIGWISDIKKYNSEEKNTIVKTFDKEFKTALESSFSDFIPKQRTNKTNPALFLKILKLYKNEFEQFMLIDFDNTSEAISQEDLDYFNSLKIKSKTSQKVVQDDEISLFECCLQILNLSSENQQYDFIKLLLKDFNNFYIQNKKITEEDKISIAKRRMELFRDFISNKQEYKYYKKMLIS